MYRKMGKQIKGVSIYLLHESLHYMQNCMPLVWGYSTSIKMILAKISRKAIALSRGKTISSFCKLKCDTNAEFAGMLQ